MKPYSVLAFLVVALVILLCLSPFESEASPGRRKSSGGGWFGSKKKQSSGGWFGSGKKNQGYGGNTGYKKKGGAMKTLKKAAVIGAVAYGGYQIGKLTSRFGGYHHGFGGHRYGFIDWNRWREVDGFMCRDSNDCNWIDARLYCQDYELDFTPSALWFGGDAARIVGECACPRGMVWDDYEMECETTFFGGIGMIMGVLVILSVLLCCCGCAAFVIFRKFF